METNLTEFNNMTAVFDPSPMTLTGTINGTEPITAAISGNVSAVCHVPPIHEMFILELYIAIILTIMLLIMIINLAMVVLSRGYKHG